MYKIRIYDAEFATFTGATHHHLETFWWVDDQGNKGKWSRLDAYKYVSTHSAGTVYVAEGIYKVNVRAYYYGAARWIQTEIDGVRRDNLTELAERHRLGLVNS